MTTPRHGLGAEHLTGKRPLIVLRTSCGDCDLLIITTGRSVRQAKRRSYRAIRAHRGTAYAAGPGWQAVAA